MFSPFSVESFSSSRRSAPKGSVSSPGSSGQGSSYWQRISEKVQSGGRRTENSRDRKQVDDQLPLHNIDSRVSNSQRSLTPQDNPYVLDTTRHINPDWARREYLRPDTRDPRVVNEVHRGVSPEDMGMDYDRKPLPIGVRVKKDVGWTAQRYSIFCVNVLYDLEKHNTCL